VPIPHTILESPPQGWWRMTRRVFDSSGQEKPETLAASLDLSTLIMAASAMGIGGWQTWVNHVHAPGRVVFVGHDADGRTCKITRVSD
jgi:hypothetical protein